MVRLSERDFWQLIYRGLMMMAKAIAAKYGFGKRGTSDD
jgi:hypothetical protein